MSLYFILLSEFGVGGGSGWGEFVSSIFMTFVFIKLLLLLSHNDEQITYPSQTWCRTCLLNIEY